MTALQWIIKEAKILRKKSPKIEWKKAVAQASAIYASKHKGKSPVGKKKTAKKVGSSKIIDHLKISDLKKGLAIVSNEHPEWGTYIVDRKYDKGIWEISNNRGTRILDESEVKFWRKLPSKFTFLSGTKKKKPNEQSILNKIHTVKHDVEKLDEAQHKHMMSGLTKIVGKIFNKYYVEFMHPNGYKFREYYNKYPTNRFVSVDRYIYVPKLTQKGTSLVALKHSKTNKQVKK